MTTRQKSDKLEIAKAQARESAEKNRNLLFGSMLIFAFLILVVLQTTDVDLLLGKAIKLPVVDVDIPLFAFYFLSAPLAFFVHLNLLRNIEAHAGKLQAWQKANQGKPLKAADLFPFIFDFAVVDHESPLAPPTRWLNQLVIYWLGTLTLLLIFWRFTDYQDPVITAFHAALLSLDLYVLRIAREKILGILFNTESEKTDENKNLSAWEGVKRKLFLFLGGWTCTRKEKGEKLSQFAGFAISIIFYIISGLFLAFTFPILPVSNLDERVRDIPPSQFSTLFRPILIIDQRENLLAFDQSLLRLQHELSFGSKEGFGEWFMKHGVGLDLLDRNLRYAQLENVDLRRAQLIDADLFKADLTNAKLQGADLTRAELQAANLWSAKLQGADLWQTNLQGSLSRNINLQGAYLGATKLQGANLVAAHLQGANLWSAKLQGADLQYAHFQGANLEDAKLQGANLYLAYFQGADLEDADLQGTYLRSTQELQGADLTGVDMKDTFTAKGRKMMGATGIDQWDNLRMLGNDISYYNHDMRRKYRKRLDRAENRLKDNNWNAPQLEAVSSERLIKTLTKTLCDMELESQKHALEGIVRNYNASNHGSGSINITFSGSRASPRVPQEMVVVHDHFKSLEGHLDCQES